MKYISIDIETTGLDPETCQVLEVGAVIDDLSKKIESYGELDTFSMLIEHKQYTGQPVALAMNQRIFEKLGKLDYLSNVERNDAMALLGICNVNFFVDEFKYWLISKGYKPNKSGKIHFVLGGKNVAGFDLQFLKRLPRWGDNFIVDARPVDPGMLYTDLLKDKRIPSLSECKKRAGFDDTDVSHEALDDAFDVVRLVRYKVGLDPLTNLNTDAKG